MLYDKIRDELKAAMLKKDRLTAETLKGMLAAFTNKLVAEGRKPQEVPEDEICLAVVRRLVKQRRESIEQFQKGGRLDLAETEEKELAILKNYLPAEAGPEEIKKVVLAQKTRLNIADRSQSGILVGAALKELKGRADGQKVKEIVDSFFD